MERQSQQLLDMAELVLGEGFEQRRVDLVEDCFCKMDDEEVMVVNMKLGLELDVIMMNFGDGLVTAVHYFQQLVKELDSN